VTAEPGDLRRGLPTSYLVAVLSRGVRELGRLRRLAAGAGKRLPVLTVDTEVTFADPAAQAAFAEDLTASVSAVVARHGVPAQAAGARSFRVIVGSYPLPPDEPAAPEPRDVEEHDA
jgi:hypothetical protein